MSKIDDEQEEKFMLLMETGLGNLRSKDDLLEFVGTLLDAYEAGYFEEQSVVDYLEGFEGLLSGLDNWYRNNQWGDKAPEQPDWQLVGKLLHAAFYHS